MKNGGKGRKSRQKKKRKGALESGRQSSQGSEMDHAEIAGARESTGNWWKDNKDVIREIHPKDVTHYKDDFKKRVSKMFKGVELSTGIRQESKAA